ncbi:protein of unknown function [Candidatus Methylocalor cossyra]|uniref:Ig-like domain-containing protein n=1 Tax=Candidatus Methylocalor cossyra TaxID=3108543 RepID=A0ABM9NFC5_9GAMM
MGSAADIARGEYAELQCTASEYSAVHETSITLWIGTSSYALSGSLPSWPPRRQVLSSSAGMFPSWGHPPFTPI